MLYIISYYIYSVSQSSLISKIISRGRREIINLQPVCVCVGAHSIKAYNNTTFMH